MTALPTHFRLTTPHGVGAVPAAVEIGRDAPGGSAGDDRPEENFLDNWDWVEVSWWGGVAGSVVFGHGGDPHSAVDRLPGFQRTEF